jgi:Flp pilus assembly protein TadG
MIPSGRKAGLRSLAAFAADCRGNGAAEFAIWIAFLALPILNVVNVGFYVFQTMQVREAAQSAAQTVSTACGQKGNTPAASVCAAAEVTAGTTLTSVLTTAAQSTTLGSQVTVNTGSTNSYENYFCTNISGGLTAAGTTQWALIGGTPATKPTSCGATVTGNTQVPGDYVIVSVSYPFQPLFTGLSILSSQTITQSAWMRIG